MMRVTNKDAYKHLIGKRIRITHMEGDQQYVGKEGVVEFVDDLPSLHGTWGGLGVLCGIDEFKVIGDK